jgi:probable HAF family extracellular repeat protein
MKIIFGTSCLRRAGMAAGLLAATWCGTARADGLSPGIDAAIDSALDEALGQPDHSHNIDSTDIISTFDGSILAYAGKVSYFSNGTYVTVPFTGEIFITATGAGSGAAATIQWDAAQSFGGEGGATDISGDPFVTGYLDHGVGTPYHAFRYDTETGQTLDLGTLTEDGQSIGRGVSADGGVVAGLATVEGGWQHAFRWTEAGGMVDLGSAAGGARDQARAMGVSDDGAVVFGASDFLRTDGISGTVSHAFRWTEDGGYQDLGVIGNNNSIAMAATPDGGVIVGGGGNRAFRWAGATGMVDLGAPEGAAGAGSIATGVSDNGRIVVGSYSTADDGLGGGGHVDNFGDILNFGGDGTMHAFRWTDAAQGGTGMADLRTLMEASGVDMTGIDLVTAGGISGDGQYIVGRMTTPETGPSQTKTYLLQYCDDFVDACSEGGVTTPDDQAVSVQDLADARAAVSEHLGATAGLLLGSLSPVSGASDAGVFAGAGSATGGMNGRWGDDDFTLLGGLALTQQEYGAVDVRQALVFAGGLRHVWPGGALRPFAEVGGWVAPDVGMTFSRSYANGAGTATGSGDTSGLAASLYAKGGVIWTPSPGNEVALAGTYQHNWLQTDAYMESSAGNPFPASFSDGTLEADVLKLSLAWTANIDDRLDLTVMGAVGRAFTSGHVEGTVAGGGTATAGVGDYTLWEFGTRVGYSVSDRLRLNGFALASTGTDIGTHWTVGGGLSLKF